jgi:hypothetical protein
MSRRTAPTGEAQLGPAAWLAYVIPVVMLVVIWLLAAYRAGGYQAHSWMPLAIFIGFAGLVVAALRAYGRLPSRNSLLVVGLFALYIVWMALSIIWAVGRAAAWEESARACFYLVFLALAVTYLSAPEGQRGARPLLLAAGLVIVAISLFRLATTSGLQTDYFLGRRFAFPLTYPNAAGSFYLLLTWPLLWLAADPRGRSWVRGLSLGTMTALLELGFLTQSRGAAAGLVISAMIYFLLSPARLRSLLFLAVPAILVALAFAPLTAYYTDGVATIGRSDALWWVGGSWAIAAGAGLTIGLADRHVHVSSRVRWALSVVVIVALIGGASFGLVRLQSRAGGLSQWVRSTASSVVSLEVRSGDQGLGGSRFGDFGGNGRGMFWRTAWLGFAHSPVVGNGVGSYPYLNELYRARASVNAQQAHSIELDQLGDTGVIGFVLFMVAFVYALGISLAPRFRSWLALARRRRPLMRHLRSSQSEAETPVAAQAWTVALVAAVLLWFVHASVEWLWHFAGVTLGALLLLAWAITSTAQPTPTENGDGPAPPRRRPDLLFRIGLGVFSVATLVGVGLPYLSIQYQNAGVHDLASRPQTALGRAATAHSLFPVSPGPFYLRADTYRSVAADAAELTGRNGQGQEVLDGLALSLAAEERAASADDASFMPYYRAGLAALDLLAARTAGATIGDRAGSWAGSGQDALPGTAAPPAAAGGGGANAAMTMATESERARAREILGLTDEQLLARASDYFQAAKARNPLQPQVNELLDAVRAASGAQP